MRIINIVMIVFLFSLVLFIQPASALIASSEHYSVDMFGTGFAASNISSPNYGAESISTTQGSTRNAKDEDVTVNVGFFGNTTYHVSVSISSYSITPSSATVGSTIGLYISALNAQSVWAKITSPNSQEQTLTLTNNQVVNYLPSPSVVGTYSVVFYANSSSGDIASVVSSFALTAQTTAPGGGSSGGGGGGGGGGTTTVIEERCDYNWDCTPWSLCSNGRQTRTCKNIGTCTGTESKPVEEMECREALFDIALNLKDINLTYNKTLKFNINLTEKISGEKIDVHIKYTIIDSNNNEIFSQIETKAIQKSLFYEKDISEFPLKDGDYTVRVDISYGNLQRAFTEQKIKILNGKIVTGEEHVSTIKKVIEFLGNNIKFIIIPIIILISLYLLFRVVKSVHKVRLVKHVKKKYVIRSLLSISVLALLTSVIRWTMTGKATKNISSQDYKMILIPIVMILACASIFILRKRIASIFREIINSLYKIINKPIEHNSHNILGLIGKKVYLGNGDHLGKVKEIGLGRRKIESIIIEIDKTSKVKVKVIEINYKYVKNVGEVVLIDEAVAENLEEYKYSK